MGTLYIDRKGLHVKLDGNALAFYANGKREGTAPIAPLKRVIVVGNITLEASVLNRLADQGVAVLFLSGRSTRFHGMLHGRLHNNGILRVKQYEKSLSPFSLAFAKEIVQSKVNGQLALLNDAVAARPDLRFPLMTAARTLWTVKDRLEDLVLEEPDDQPCSGEAPEGAGRPIMGTFTGLEGSASAAYFAAFTTLFPESLRFTHRNRRPPRDPVNALLSLCYTMLHYELVREIEAMGLDPTIGFYHQFDYGRESLACDLVEFFRPAVDRLVWGLFRERRFTDRDFGYEGDRAGCRLKKGGRKTFYFLYEEWARAARPQFRAQARSLARRIMDGCDDLPDDWEHTALEEETENG